jgi:hypothetical protein
MQLKNCLRQIMGSFFVVLLCNFNLGAAPATLLFEDTFDRAAPGWTAVQPLGVYIDGPLRWQYDIVSGAWVETSNLYTDAAANSSSATAAMLINDTAAPADFTYRARLLTGDDDGFGLIFGFENDVTFYRVTFARQPGRLTNGFPGTGWQVDRKLDDVRTVLFGSGTTTGAHSFTNRVGFPFDVTIAVNAGLFSLTVIDDPTGAATTHNLVVDQPLPGSAAGRVGLMTWGQSGNVPRGFRISNLDLDPVDLVNWPPTNQLPAWTAVVPPRAGGSATMGGHGQGLWSLALNANGPYGTLNETSDAVGGNDAAGQLDFISPSLVAGDVNWSNYVLSARLLAGDDDGSGLLLRYQNTTTFYRVAFRTQASGTGARRGLSVQKVVGGTWESIFFETAPQFVPTVNVPFDVLAAISGNQLQIVVINNPLGNAQAYFYGPFDMAGANALTSDTGQIGVFSWGQSLMQFDNVRVQQVEGVPLLVTSAFGNPNPAVGLHDFASDSVIDASVEDIVITQPGIRRVSTGFTGFGSVPASGTSTNLMFTLTNASLITWQWRTEYRVVASAQTGGTVNGLPSEWLPAGTNVTITALPDAGYLFLGWSGDTFSTEPVLQRTVNRPLSLTARFTADSDGDGLADNFEQTYFGNLAQGANDDPDNDGRTNLDEFRFGTSPDFNELLVSSDGLSSTFENVQRDIALPGIFVVRDFGQGYRGPWEASNDFRGADDITMLGSTNNIVPNASFEGPRLIIRTNAWNPSWDASFTAQVIFSVGDNDGNCVYWRYQNESNWFRVTLTGENNEAIWRAPFGVSIQKRVNGVYSEIARSPAIFTDPDDATDPSNEAGWKRIRVTIISLGNDHVIQVEGWDVLQNPPEWSGFSLTELNFTDTALQTGRLGIGSWGQGGDPRPPTAQIPVDDGVLFEDVRVEVNAAEVFHENWASTPLENQLPAGWTNPLAGTPGAEGDWRRTAHGTIVQLGNYATTTSGTVTNAAADGDGPILLAPAPGVANYTVEMGFHPFDNDGIGFVYDFVDSNNFARVIFVNEATAPTRIPQGLNVSRKINGVWSDIMVGDTTFIYRPGYPFAVHFANNNGEYTLRAWEMDQPNAVFSWRWTGTAASAASRFGAMVWGEQDAHILYARARSLPAQAVEELRIGGIQLSGGNVILSVVNSGGAYDVEMNTDLNTTTWNVVAGNQTGAQVSVPVPVGPTQAFYRLKRVP